MSIRLLLLLMVLDLFAVAGTVIGGTSLSDVDRTAGGAATYSRSDYADYLRKRKMPAYQTERDTKYRFMTPELIDEYARSICPRENIPAGVAVTTQERDAREWLMERKAIQSHIEQAASEADKQIEQSIRQLQSARTVEELDNILKSMYGGAYPESFKALEEAALPVLKTYNPELYNKKIAAIRKKEKKAEKNAAQKQAEEDLKNLQARQNSQEAQQRMAQERIEHQIRELKATQTQLESEKILK